MIILLTPALCHTLSHLTGYGEMYYVCYLFCSISLRIYIDIIKNCKSELYSPALEKQYDIQSHAAQELHIRSADTFTKKAVI